jgi:hypothetical protein
VSSDPELLAAYRRQCEHGNPWVVLLAWQGQEGVDPDDLIDITKDVSGNLQQKEQR